MGPELPSEAALRTYRRPILVVEDEGAVADLVAAVLEADGLEVVKTTNGQEALEWMDRAREVFPAVVLLDIKMPVMDGREFARRFVARWDSLAPIIVMTAYNDAAGIAEELGAAAWIGKPFDIAELSEKVRANAARSLGG